MSGLAPLPTPKGLVILEVLNLLLGGRLRTTAARPSSRIAVVLRDVLLVLADHSDRAVVLPTPLVNHLATFQTLRSIHKRVAACPRCATMLTVSL